MADFGNFLRNRRLQVRILSRVFVTPYKASYLQLALFFVNNRFGVYWLAWACRSSTLVLLRL
jgi:hypothetical protein